MMQPGRMLPLLALAWLFTACDSQQPNAPVWTHPELGFSILVPQGWEATPDYQDIALVLRPGPARRGDGVFININVIAHGKIDATPDLENFAQTRVVMLSQLTHSQPDFEVIDARLAGRPAKRISGLVQYGPEPLRIESYNLLMENNDGISVTAAAHATAWPAWKKELERIVSSLTL